MSATTRDRITSIGARAGQTADEVVSGALDTWEDQQYWNSYAAAHAQRSPGQISEDKAENALWNTASADG